MNYIKPVTFIILLTLFNILADEFPILKIYTEDWKPYQYIENNSLKGLSVEIAEAVLKESGSSQDSRDFILVPWSRAYKLTQNNKNTMIFSIVRTIERQEIFKFSNPFYQYNMYLVGKKS